MNTDNRLPGILIAAPGSGSGKTLITCALLQILKMNNYKPSSFKCGPDYIDPMFHKKVLGVPSRNLDVFLSGRDGVIACLKKGMRESDLAVIEGVMGLYDGVTATSLMGSSYDIAKITNIPVILVINCKGMSKSIIPLIKGFAEYGDLRIIAGIILNNISDMLFDKIKDDILRETGIPVIAHLPYMGEASFESRHLGLVMPDEIGDVLAKIGMVSERLKERLDLKKLLKIAYKDTGVLSNYSPEFTVKSSSPVRVGIARDEAFCFYYDDNIDMLKELGAEFIFFSPIRDKSIPDVSRLIFGGGYPELYAEALSKNESMLDSIREAALNGMPILAECGGFLYLQDKMETMDKKTFDMAGIFPGKAFNRGTLRHFGYVNVISNEDNPYLKKNEIIRGHEFHYFDTTDNGDVCDIKKPYSERFWKGYKIKDNVFGGFAHLYYPSNMDFIKRFIER